MSKTGIYKITSPTGRVYIGQAKNIKSRWSSYKTMHHSIVGQIKLYRSFVKHGVENHTFEIIEECSIEQLNKRERFWQDYYDVLNRGLNCVLVATDELLRVYSDENKIRLIKAFSGKNNPMFGKIYTDKEKQNLKDKLSGALSPVSKLVLDTQTGIFYYTIKEASEAYNIKYYTLVAYLIGSRTNKTNLINI